MDNRTAMQLSVRLNRVGEQLRENNQQYDQQLVELAVKHLEETVKQCQQTSGLTKKSDDDLINTLQQSFASYYVHSSNNARELDLVKLKMYIDEVTSRLYNYAHNRREIFNDEAFNC